MKSFVSGKGSALNVDGGRQNMSADHGAIACFKTEIIVKSIYKNSRGLCKTIYHHSYLGRGKPRRQNGDFAFLLA